MFLYMLSVFAAAVLFSTVLALILRKNNILSVNTILAMFVSSVVISVSFPFVVGMLIDSSANIINSAVFKSGTIWVFLGAAVIFIILVFIFTVLISIFIPDRKIRQALDTLEKSDGTVIADNQGNNTDIMESNTDIIESNTGIPEDRANETGNMPVEAISTIPVEKGTENGGLVEMDKVAAQEESNIEKFVDTGENIDKMGLEKESNAKAREQTATSVLNAEVPNMASPEENMNIVECVDRAFRLKENGDFEGAILYYLYALDKNPDDGLAFWIVLDICVLYKALGQIEIAKNILDSYIDNYGNIMNESVKVEIESNLV